MPDRLSPLFPVYLIIIALEAVLLLLSRGTADFPGEEVPLFVRPARRAAVCLCSRFLWPLFGERWASGGKFSGPQYRLMHPGERAQAMRRACVERVSCVLFFGFAGAAAGIVCCLLQAGQEPVREIRRRAYRQGAREVSLTAYAEGEEVGRVLFSVSPGQLTAEEADSAFEELREVLPSRILGENPGPEEVSENLILPEAVEGFPFVLSYRSSDPDLLSDRGEVFPELLAGGEKRAVTLQVEAESPRGTYSMEMALSVYRPEPGEEGLREAIGEALRRQDEETAERPVMVLPAEASGSRLLFYPAEEGRDAELFLLMVFGGLAGLVLMEKKDRDWSRRRERELALAYPRLISRLTLYVGAGVSVRSAFLRIQASMEQEGRGGEFAAEEISRVCHELEGGIPEETAFAHLGERCGLRSYMRLSSLLSQNTKRGNDALVQALQSEADSAFAERRDMARVLGEEAGTKLLFPMMMLLAAALLPVVLPALLSFAG